MQTLPWFRTLSQHLGIFNFQTQTLAVDIKQQFIIYSLHTN